MIPRMTIFQRALAWLLWKLESINGWCGFDDDMEGAQWVLFEHPNMSAAVQLMRDYYYVKKAKEYEDER